MGGMEWRPTTKRDHTIPSQVNHREKLAAHTSEHRQMKYKEGDLMLCVRDRDYGIVLSIDETPNQLGNPGHYYVVHWAQDGRSKLSGSAVDRQPDQFKLVSR